MTEEQEKALLEKIDAMEKVIDEFVNGYNKSEDEYNRSEFKKRNGDKLSKYSDEFKYWEGDDFDLADKAYDELHSDDFKDWTEEDYINKLINVLEEQLKKNKEHYADKDEDAIATSDERCKEAEAAIESNPVEAAQKLPQGSPIQKEAVQAIDGGKDAEVNNKAVDGYVKADRLGKEEEDKAYDDFLTQTRDLTSVDDIYSWLSEHPERVHDYSDSWIIESGMFKPYNSTKELIPHLVKKYGLKTDEDGTPAYTSPDDFADILRRDIEDWKGNNELAEFEEYAKAHPDEGKKYR